MHRLSYIIVLLFIAAAATAQSPHGSNLKIDCAQCHNPIGWEITVENMKFNHSSTNFELEGAHKITDCKSCHSNLVFENTPTDCLSCHIDIHSQSVGNDCMRCHTSDNWLVFNIPELHEENGFPLIGSHSNLSCVECHTTETSLIFNRLGNECIECHRDDYLATQSPNHLGAGFGQDCLECHNPMGFGWDSTGIIHDFFPLTMGHDIQDCSACHNVSNFSDISADCFACHQQDYQTAQNPNHQNAGFPTDCIQCHTTAIGWMPATIDHDFFPLTLGHDIQDCNACHINGNFNNTPTDCFACHQQDYQTTQNPNHQAAGFPTECAICHSTNPGWMPAVVNHDFFPLTLGHDIQDCNACHGNGVYEGTPTDCFACHQQDYQTTQNPNHPAAGFPTDCVLCHTTNPGWMPATFNHDFFPLTLGHDIGDCNACHGNGVYEGTPTDCFACHQQDYQTTQNPNHQAAGFSTDCVLCHTTNPGWMPATFNHDFFPLTLGHDIGDCNACHGNGVYEGTPTDCFACHQEDYQTAQNPNHLAANFPTDCVLCHTTNPGWMPANFDHDNMYFPIYSGKHEDEWSSCTDCHMNPSNYAIFDCLSCHPPGETADEHDDVGGYIYESNACFACHPDGEG